MDAVVAADSVSEMVVAAVVVVVAEEEAIAVAVIIVVIIAVITDVDGRIIVGAEMMEATVKEQFRSP